jgi:hypothetical protein
VKIRTFITGAALVAVVATGGVLTACSSDADVASKNLSTAADNFEVQRRIVFVNGITDKYLLVIEGRCSLGNTDKAGELSVTCKVGPNQFAKHFLGLSDNVTYVVEQIEAVSVSTYHYRVVFRPEEIIPDITIK